MALIRAALVALLLTSCAHTGAVDKFFVFDGDGYDLHADIDFARAVARVERLRFTKR